MSADARISLSFIINQIQFDKYIECELHFPDSKIDSLKFVKFPCDNKGGIAALVRSLIEGDSREIKVCYCESCKMRIYWSTIHDYDRLNEVLTHTVSSFCGCGKGRHISNLENPTTYTRLKEQEYDSKLKLTFGAGSHVNKIVIEPLKGIEQLCEELGIETFFIK